jgi:hypothetical protein
MKRMFLLRFSDENQTFSDAYIIVQTPREVIHILFLFSFVISSACSRGMMNFTFEKKTHNGKLYVKIYFWK